MANFNEHALELSIIELLQNKGYIHQTGSELLREKSEVLIVDDLKQYLHTRCNFLHKTGKFPLIKKCPFVQYLQRFYPFYIQRKFALQNWKNFFTKEFNNLVIKAFQPLILYRY